MAVIVLNTGLYNISQSISVNMVNNSSPICMTFTKRSECYIGVFSYNTTTGIITGEPIISNCTMSANSSKRNSMHFLSCGAHFDYFLLSETAAGDKNTKPVIIIIILLSSIGR